MDSLMAWMKPFEYDDINHFYHVTTPDNKDEIVRSGELGANLAQIPHGQLPSAIHEKVSGVLFTCTLVEDERGLGASFGDGRHILPTASPHGTERIQIPVTYLGGRPNSHLFYDLSYNIRGQRYVTLVLLEEGDPNYKFCRENMIHLDMANNPFLQLDSDNNRYKCCYKENLWVEVFVLGSVPIPIWDQVTEVPVFPRQPSQQELANKNE